MVILASLPFVGLTQSERDTKEGLVLDFGYWNTEWDPIEFGDGFQAARMKGSEHNDPFDNVDKSSSLTLHTSVKPGKNGAGGINGGITNGNPIVFRVAFKPTSSIGKSQKTFNFATGQMTSLEIPGRHDACIALRTPVIDELMCKRILKD